MKSLLKALFLVMVVAMTMPMYAQVPQKMNYQAVARNSSGQPITNHLIGLKFTIRETSASGPDLFAETTSATTNSLGTFSVEIGGGTAVLGAFSSINWSSGPKFLNIKIDPSGGSSYTDMGSFQLLSVAYAELAQNVVNNDDNDASPTNELQNLSIAGNQLTISSGNTVSLPTGADNWGSQVAITDATLSGNGLAGTPLKLAQQGATSGQVLKWNGTSWLPGADNTGGGGTSPAGSNGNVQFNNSGSFGADADLGWDNTTKKLFVGSSGSTGISRLCIGGTGYYGAALGLKNVNEYSLSSGDDGNFRMIKVTGSTFTPLLVTSLGNFGINLPGGAPMGQMEINSNSTTSAPHLMLTESENDFARIGFRNTTNPSKYWHVAGYTDAIDGNSKLNMWYYNGATGSDILSIFGNGRIGINTTTPEYVLDVFAGSNSSYATFKNTSTGSGMNNGLLLGIKSDGATSYLWNYENGPIIMATNNIDRITIAADGKVGIGTATAAALTEISGGGSGLTFPTLKASNANASGVAAYLTNNSSDATLVVTNSIGASATNSIIAKFFDGGASDLIRFDNFGGANRGAVNLFGSNTSSAGGGIVYGESQFGLVGACWYSNQRYVVTETRTDGTLKYFEPYFTNNVKLGSSTYKWSEVWATNGVIQTSDERDKQNVKGLNTGLNAIMQLKPVSFEWKDENIRLGTGTNLGFLAQELEQVLPDAVVHVVTPQSEIENARAAGKGEIPSDVYGVKYSEIIPVLVKAIQDQQVLINTLQEKVQKLENH